MAQTQNPHSITEQARSSLWREKWLAQGRSEAFEFALEHKGDLTELRARVQEIEEYLADPVLTNGPLAPRTSSRVHREGYLAGLREAIRLICDNQEAVASEHAAPLNNAH
jgi:hypothetical protein